MKQALILMDFQYDFFPGGMNTIEGTGDLLSKIHELLMDFEIIIATQLWHPATHISFAANHLWRRPDQEIEIDGAKIVLQNMHCVAEGFGADLRDELPKNDLSKIIKRGIAPNVLPYSAFFDQNKINDTGLLEFLKGNEVEHLVLAGVNSNNGILNTQAQAEALGFEIKLEKAFIAGL